MPLQLLTVHEVNLGGIFWLLHMNTGTSEKPFNKEEVFKFKSESLAVYWVVG